MTSPSYGDFCFPFLSESSSSMCELPEDGCLFPELQSLDPISSEGCGNIWPNNHHFTQTTLTPQRKKKGKSKKSSSCEYFYSTDQLVTKTKNHFKFKDEFLPDVDKELPDVILASPCKENTHDSITSLPRDQYFNNKHVTVSNSALPLHDDNTLSDTSFDDVYKKVQREMDLRNDSVTNDDIEYLEEILAGVLDCLPYESPLPPMVVRNETENLSLVPCSFNEISCNLNSQQATVSDSQSAIKTLLTSDSFKGNFGKKRSTEILSEMDKSNGWLFEHNYCVVDDYTKSRFPEIYGYHHSSTDKTAPIVQHIKTESNNEEIHQAPLQPKTEFTVKRKKEDRSVEISFPLQRCLIEEPVTSFNVETTSICENPTTFAQSSLKTEPLTMRESNSNEDVKATSNERKFGENAYDEMKNFGPSVLDTRPRSDMIVNEPVVVPKKEKKVISVEEYLKKRVKRNVSDIKSEADSHSNGDNKIENIKTENEPATSNVVIVENVLSNILKAKPHRKNEIGQPLNKTDDRNIKQELRPSPKFEKLKPIVKVESINRKEMKIRPTLGPKIANQTKVERRPNSNVEKSKPYPQDRNVKNESKSSSICSTTFSPNEISQSSDSCDQCSSSGISSYHNSSVSSLCGSPFTTSDEKSNDTKYQENGEATKVRKDSINLTVKESPFAVNVELLRDRDRHNSRRKHKHRNSRKHRKDSRSSKRHHRRSSPDSCYEYDSDSSSCSEKRYSRKRRRSSSSSSFSDREYYSSHAERSLSPKAYQAYVDWNYGKPRTVPESAIHYNDAPNLFYPPMPPAWHPEYAYYQHYPANFEAPYYYDNRLYETKNQRSCEAEIQKRVLFVGNIEKELTKDAFKKRFSRFGKVENVKLHFRENGNNFGFVYYAHAEDVHRAMKHGNDDPSLPQYSYGYGSRKERKDEPIFFYEKGYPPPEFVPFSKPEVDSFDLKLKQFKSELCQKKITAQSSKS